PPQRAVDDLRAERIVARVEAGEVERVLEHDVGEGLVLIDADQDAERLVARLRDGARLQDRAHAASEVTRAPAPSRAPRRKFSHAIAFLFSGCTRVGRSNPSPVAMHVAPGPLVTSAPGSEAAACGITAARQMSRRPAGVITAAPGHGLVPRTRLARARAGSSRRSQPSSFLRRGASVARRPSCGTATSEPESSSSSV